MIGGCDDNPREFSSPLATATAVHAFKSNADMTTVPAKAPKVGVLGVGNRPAIRSTRHGE